MNRGTFHIAEKLLYSVFHYKVSGESCRHVCGGKGRGRGHDMNMN